MHLSHLDRREGLGYSVLAVREKSHVSGHDTLTVYTIDTPEGPALRWCPTPAAVTTPKGNSSLGEKAVGLVSGLSLMPASTKLPPAFTKLATY